MTAALNVAACRKRLAKIRPEDMTVDTHTALGLLEEVDRLQVLLADADLALDMANGERWPKKWKWSDRDEGFRSPENDAYIKPLAVDHLGKQGMEGCPLGWQIYRRDPNLRGLSIGDKTIHSTALAALRDYLAGATS